MTEVDEGVQGASGAARARTGVDDSGGARRLAISDKTLVNWVFRARRSQLTTLGESRRSVADLEAEVSWLKRDRAEARMERNFLKKPTAYVAKAQLPGTHS